MRSCALPFLNKKEAEFIVARIEQDRHDAIAAPFSISTYLRCAADLKIWGFASLFGLTTTCTYAIAYFLPIILEDGMGFSIGEAQCLVAPPYVVAALWMFLCAVLGDKYKIRGPFIIANGVMSLIGLPLLGFATNVGARYFGVFLATTAANANVPCILTYQVSLPHSARPDLMSLLTTSTGQQHSRTVEACAGFSHTGRLWWHWRYHWVDHFPRAGQTRLQTWYRDLSDRERAHHRHHLAT